MSLATTYSRFSDNLKPCPGCNELTIKARHYIFAVSSIIYLNPVQSLGGNWEPTTGLSGDVIAWEICSKDSRMAYAEHECNKGVEL